jgi:hypothetical protein
MSVKYTQKEKFRKRECKMFFFLVGSSLPGKRKKEDKI